VRDAALDVVGIEPPVEQNRGGEVFDELMRGLAEAASPGFGFHGAPLSSLLRHAMGARTCLRKTPHRNKAPAVCQRQIHGRIVDTFSGNG
jgi:hypothetical protein